MEGSHCYNSAACDQTGLALPVAEYDHSLGCSVTGGIVYRGQDYPRMQGVYFYGDYCSGTIWGLRRAGTVWQSSVLLTTAFSISTFGEDENGNVYVAPTMAATSIGSVMCWPLPQPPLRPHS